jgi:hypothetical protein
MIDPDTARNLELVGNMAYKKSTHSLLGLFALVASRGRYNTDSLTQSVEPYIYGDGGSPSAG